MPSRYLVVALFLALLAAPAAADTMNGSASATCFLPSCSFSFGWGVPTTPGPFDFGQYTLHVSITDPNGGPVQVSNLNAVWTLGGNNLGFDLLGAGLACDVTCFANYSNSGFFGPLAGGGLLLATISFDMSGSNDHVDLDFQLDVLQSNVPEPGTLGLLATGLLAGVSRLRRRFKA